MVVINKQSSSFSIEIMVGAIVTMTSDSDMCGNIFVTMNKTVFIMVKVVMLRW